VTVLLYAHRGSSARLPEHTRAAYLAALADGADGVECDVHLTADGQVVLMHDPTVDRTSDGTGPVAAHTLAQLRALDTFSWKGVPLPSGAGELHEQLLTLDELLDVLTAAGRPVGLAVEFKHEPAERSFALEDAALAVLAARDLDGLDVSFMSFSAAAIGHLLAAGVPGERLCQLVEEGFAEGAERLDDGSVGIAGPGLDYLAAHPERVRSWVTAGRTLRVWTVDHAADVRRCLDIGAQEITTNDPSAVRRELRPRTPR
jgi:glycerophosphoryl diester phosphodiesterase